MNISVTIPHELAVKLEAAAVAEHRNKSSFVRAAVIDRINAMHKPAQQQHTTQQGVAN